MFDMRQEQVTVEILKKKENFPELTSKTFTCFVWHCKKGHWILVGGLQKCPMEKISKDKPVEKFLD